MKRILILPVLAVVLAIPATTHAATTTDAPGNVKVVTIPTAGCHIASHRTTRGAVIIDGIACPAGLYKAYPIARYIVTPTTITFTTPANPACDTPFTITIAGAVAYTDTLGGTCPPPDPAPVVVTRTGNTVTLTNPATVAQTGTYGYVVGSLDGVTFTGDGAFTATARQVHSGTAANPTITYWYELVVVLAPGATVTVVQS